MAIEGKVARLLSEREVVLNIGSNHGVTKGMRFKILNPLGEDIPDPDTGLRLGSLDLVKVEVEVTQVQAKLSVAQTFRRTVIPARQGSNSMMNTLSTLSSLSARVLSDFDSPEKVVYETLRLSKNSPSTGLDEEESFVKVGDPVVEM